MLLWCNWNVGRLGISVAVYRSIRVISVGSLGDPGCRRSGVVCSTVGFVARLRRLVRFISLIPLNDASIQNSIHRVVSSLAHAGSTLAS